MHGRTLLEIFASAGSAAQVESQAAGVEKRGGAQPLTPGAR